MDVAPFNNIEFIGSIHNESGKIIDEAGKKNIKEDKVVSKVKNLNDLNKKGDLGKVTSLRTSDFDLKYFKCKT